MTLTPDAVVKLFKSINSGVNHDVADVPSAFENIGGCDCFVGGNIQYASGRTMVALFTEIALKLHPPPPSHNFFKPIIYVIVLVVWEFSLLTRTRNAIRFDFKIKSFKVVIWDLGNIFYTKKRHIFSIYNALEVASYLKSA